MTDGDSPATRAKPQRPRREPQVERLSWMVASGIIGLSLVALVAPMLSNGTEPGGDARTLSTNSSGDAADSEVTVSVDAETAVDERFTISVSGDILIHERVADAAATGNSYDFAKLFEPVKSLIETRDFAICHLEVPLSSTNTDLAYGTGVNAGVFRVPNQLADALVATGFDSCSAASNHSYDSGESSVLATVEQMKRVGLPYVGLATSPAEADFLWQFDVKGTIVGHLAYAFALNGREPGSVPIESVALIDEAKILADAARQRAAGSEFIIVSLHWGNEFESSPSDQQLDLGPRLLASPDIDLIIGHHAHVPQPIVEIDGEYIAYGLGNLLSNQSSSAPECPDSCPLESQDGALVDFVVDRRADGTMGVVDVVVNPTWVDVGGTWKVIDTQSPPAIGVAVDTLLLSESADRTWATMGFGPG